MWIVDTAIYGAPRRYLTCCQVLERYPKYGDSVLGKYGKNKPNVGDVVKPIIGLFHAAPRNGLWKRNTDAAFQHCVTLKSFFEETLETIPDRALDEPLEDETFSCVVETFANSKNLLPPPCNGTEGVLCPLVRLSRFEVRMNGGINSVDEVTRLTIALLEY